MRRNLVVIGASAGGIEALRVLMPTLGDLPAAVLIVVHVPAHARSVLPEILGRLTSMRVKHAEHGDPLEEGAVLIAPPGHHLLVEGDHVRLSRGPREHGHRPAVDPLFRSAARARGLGVVGVILSGALDDGTAGMLAIQLRGGATVVQDPRDARHESMPRSVVEHLEVDHVVPIHEMGEHLASLVRETLPTVEREETKMQAATPSSEEGPPLPEAESAAEAPIQDARNDRDGVSSGLTCPDCHGALWEIVDGKVTIYRCRTGHAFAPQSLLAMQAEGVEEAMWAAYRALEENADMARRLGSRMREKGLAHSADRYDQMREAALARARLVRSALELAAGGAIDSEPALVDDDTGQPK